jgi:hypothetical protein
LDLAFPVEVTGQLSFISGPFLGCSVSGGSILNGFLATRLPKPLSSGIEDFESAASKPVREFCSLDIRRWLALEAVIPGTHNSMGLATQYDQHLTAGKMLIQIPATPVHVFCTTDLAYRVNWTFTKETCGDYQAGRQSTPRVGWSALR